MKLKNKFINLEKGIKSLMTCKSDLLIKNEQIIEMEARNKALNLKLSNLEQINEDFEAQNKVCWLRNVLISNLFFCCFKKGKSKRNGNFKCANEH